MIRFKTLLPALVACVLLLTLVALPAYADAGGCPMCKASANALGESGQRALNHGILILMVPVAVAFGTIGYLIFKRRTG